MTKRDVAVCFCKLVAWMGIIQGVFDLFQSALFLFLPSLRIAGARWPFFVPVGLSIGLYLLIWFFADSIGTELAAEGEHSSPVTSRQELGWLFVRGVGLWLFISATIEMAPSLFSLVYDSFFAARTAPSNHGWRWALLIAGFAQSLFGFLLAFTPRIRAFLHK